MKDFLHQMSTSPETWQECDVAESGGWNQPPILAPPRYAAQAAASLLPFPGYQGKDMSGTTG